MIATQPHDDGAAGVSQTLALLAAMKDYYGTVPAIRTAALIIAGTRADDDQATQAAALAEFVRRSLVYQMDPVNAEFIQTPDVLLNEISDHGTAAGDCDDHVLLFCSIAEALGIACSVAGVPANGSPVVNHVIAVAHLPAGDVDVDLCAKLGFVPEYPVKEIYP